MTQPAVSPPSRLAPGPTVGWALLLLVVAALLVMFFAFDSAARPLFDGSAVTGGGLAGWPLS
jgi:hypothetical protein